MKRRVVITGAGAISPIGKGTDEFWRNCLEGKSAVAPIPVEWTRYADLQSCLWAPLPDYDPKSFGIGRTDQLQLDPVTVLAIGAAHEAIIGAGFTLSPCEERSRNFILSGSNSNRFGVYFGTGIGGAHSFLENHAVHLYQRARAKIQGYTSKLAAGQDTADMLNDALALMQHRQRFNPFVVSMLMPNSVSAMVGIKFSITGPNMAYCVACAAGTVAVGNGYRAVRDGLVDAAITGGSEYLAESHGAIFRGFDVAGTLVRNCEDPNTANRPFDVNRSGFLYSQGGAAALVLEELEHARRRDAPIIAELIGYAESFDAYSMMSLAPGGAQIERMLRAAMDDAGLTAAEVDYVNAHGTGTRNNDDTEAQVIDRVFGKSVHVNSTKSLLGHTIGASGAFEALVTALTLRDGKTHVCKNLEVPSHDLNFVRHVENFGPDIGLSQSFAFGGHNAAVVLRRYEG